MKRFALFLILSALAAALTAGTSKLYHFSIKVDASVANVLRMVAERQRPDLPEMRQAQAPDFIKAMDEATREMIARRLTLEQATQATDGTSSNDVVSLRPSEKEPRSAIRSLTGAVITLLQAGLQDYWHASRSKQALLIEGELPLPGANLLTRSGRTLAR
jgi:hypothetical protein